ncbi:nucleopolyhedrovirus P10 family protein [Streptomyces sp. NPDC088747]|uniref:nucleopolyhedrovirus P10 family protein n=1 Tax=Streptomyces sp. NPDC088747 TaxID=3365886 RepID=UPI00380961CF
MTVDAWAQVVRHRLGLGRLLPLGVAGDGVWITEGAAEAVLRRAAAPVRGVRLGTLRIALADPERSRDPAVPAPPSALPPGPLRVSAEFTAWADPTAPDAEPLPTTAARLRVALAEAATEGLGLTVTEVDLRVTGLPAEDQETAAVRPADVRPADLRPADVRPAAEPTGADEARVAAAALSVPGVTHLTDALGRSVHIEDGGPAGGDALPRRHVRVELAVSGRAAEVAREVRRAVTDSLPDSPSVAVVVTSAH